MRCACSFSARMRSRVDLPTRIGPSTAINLGGSRGSDMQEKPKITHSNPDSMLTGLFSAGVFAGLAAGAYFYAGLFPTSQIFGRTLLAGNNPNELALTFDDGPNDPYT